MKSVLIYKGYYTRVCCSPEDRVFHGKIEGIRGLVNFECNGVGDVEKAFHEAVDDYLLFCQDNGIEPETVIVSPELKKQYLLE